MAKLDQASQRVRREHILDAAEHCFAAHGFHSTSIQDICREAAISPGALYLYFASKEDLIAGICEREKSELAQALASVGEAPDFMAALSRLGQTYCLDQPLEKLRLHLEINAEAMRNPAIGETVRAIDKFVLDSFERLLAEAKAKGRINPAVDLSTIAQIISVLGDGLYLRRALEPEFDGKACMTVIVSLISSLIGPVTDGTDGGGEPLRVDHEQAE
jgi:AcrR family transcriptional regulator